MQYEPDATESLLTRTKKLLADRGDTPLREIADSAGVGREWVRSLAYNRTENPGIQPLEKLHNFLVEFHAARRFGKRSEVRAS